MAADFLAAMARAGVHPEQPDKLAADLAARPGELLRFRCEGDRAIKGWAKLHLDGVKPAGVYGHGRLFAGTGSRTWTPDGPPPPLIDRARLDAERRAAKAAQDTRERSAWAKTAKAALARWRAATTPVAGHPYLVRKRLAGEGLRRDGPLLIVPLSDADGFLCAYETIGPDGAKLSGAGRRPKGIGWRCGEAGAAIAIGEGMATMAAVRAATGLPVAASCGTAGLAPLARAIRAMHPAARLILCADLDAHGGGEAAARESAGSVGGTVAYPPRPPGWPASAKLDFADAWTAPNGADAIRRVFHLILRGAQ